jgi:hypothetical protein
MDNLLTIVKVAFLGFFFPRLRVCIKSDKNRLGYMLRRILHKLIWDGCYDRFLPIFIEKIGLFLNVMIKFLQQITVVWSKISDSFAILFGGNIFNHHNIGPRSP